MLERAYKTCMWLESPLKKAFLEHPLWMVFNAAILRPLTLASIIAVYGIVVLGLWQLLQPWFSMEGFLTMMILGPFLLSVSVPLITMLHHRVLWSRSLKSLDVDWPEETVILRNHLDARVSRHIQMEMLHHLETLPSLIKGLVVRNESVYYLW